jgi:hypothetical protein
MISRFVRTGTALLLVLGWKALAVDKIPINEDESKVPPYTLPDPLVFTDGRRVRDAAAWPQRRAEILELYRTHVYGHTPQGLPRKKATVLSEDHHALGGLATRKLIRVPLLGDTQGPALDILLYLPNAAKQPVPAFLGYNFNGNHAVTLDPGVPLARSWIENRRENGITNNVANEASRGCEASAWPIEHILARGYALATVYYGDVEADFAEGWKQSLRGAAAKGGTNHVFAPGEWGAIGAWAWGLSRSLDYLETDAAVDAKRVAVLGHSRLGKTSLWAGAQDERFALVIANESGEGGAALARRWFGETVWRINASFPHWFCGRFKDYNQNVPALPVDQHELIALMAPRPVYVASAEDDRWADPRGEFLGAKHAEPVYALFGQPGLGVADLPPVNTPVGGTIGYHIRTGKHALTAYDWDQYLNFADRHLKPAKP